mmetsp:Transcript_33907/g.61465  ORF Transcript_33907/g.61465 Transcript_33907/m.61465 type:complete len:103 (-) Transcript_33907:395-703(-)
MASTCMNLHTMQRQFIYLLHQLKRLTWTQFSQVLAMRCFPIQKAQMLQMWRGQAVRHLKDQQDGGPREISSVLSSQLSPPSLSLHGRLRPPLLTHQGLEEKV